MNEHDYTTIEASKRLMEAGIKLETDAVWFESLTGWIIAPLSNRYEESIPAYSFTTLWSELPEETYLKKLEGENLSWIYDEQREITSPFFTNTNPADALAELHIWVTERKEKKV